MMNNHKVTPPISSEVHSTCTKVRGDSTCSLGARGGRRMMPGSAGSPAKASDSVKAVTRLIHKIWTGASGRAIPTITATRMIKAWAPLVGSRNATDLRMLS